MTNVSVSLGYVKVLPVIILLKDLSGILFDFNLHLDHFLTELLGPLDRGDMLNEAFVGLSLAQGEDTFPDDLPPFCSTHKHIIQQRTLKVSSNR